MSFVRLGTIEEFLVVVPAKWNAYPWKWKIKEFMMIQSFIGGMRKTYETVIR